MAQIGQDRRRLNLLSLGEVVDYQAGSQDRSDDPGGS
jgi:hypothetical protein